MARTLARKLIDAHLLAGIAEGGGEIGLRIDQTLTQDATGTLVMLELEGFNLDRVKTEISVQYVDHNLIQEDFKNPDDHVFLESACRRFGIWFSRPGAGVSHPVHMQRFGKPGKSLAGSDSHTPAAGALGMLALGAGGLEVAMAMAGEPLWIEMPEIWGVRLEGALPDWVSAKDVVLEMLRRHGVRGGRGRILEYWGPGLSSLSVWDRHVIANMGTELGATTTVFPSDAAVLDFLRAEGRPKDFVPLLADEGATYDVQETLDLATVEPLIAKPRSPGDVVPVRAVAGENIYQAYIGSSANPGYRDFAIAARIVEGHRVAPGVSFDVNPTSRAMLEDMVMRGVVVALLRAGARLHQAGCNGCIGMGQAPATGRNSLRTVPRNFPGRSGTAEDSVWLCSPETAAASALRGVITDPRDLDMRYPRIELPDPPTIDTLFEPPPPPEVAREVVLVKGPNIAALPEMAPMPDELDLPILLVVGDDVSTDGIMPAGARALPFRSNIPAISRFCFEGIDASYAERAGGTPHAIVAGDNYGQGSSREHAALAPRYLGLRVVLARSFARIHHQNLVNFGVLPLVFDYPGDGQKLARGTRVHVSNLRRDLREASGRLEVRTEGGRIPVHHGLSPRQVEVVLAGGVVPQMAARHRNGG